MNLFDIKQFEIRMCWPDPDDVCLEGGCIHCAEGAESSWVTIVEVYAYATDRLQHGEDTSMRNAFHYGLVHDWYNLPKRRLNVRRAHAWVGTLDDRHYTGWEHLQREH